MSIQARLVGTFTPVPDTAGFELPIFRTMTSDMPLIQVIGDNGVVADLIHRDVGGVVPVYGVEILTGPGSPAVFAVRRPNGMLESGTRDHLKMVLPCLIEAGEFDAVPLTRFRLSAFLEIRGRQAADALAAWGWIESTSSQWAADTWKVEGTIVPEFRRRISSRLRTAGETQESIECICQTIEAGPDADGRIALSVQVPGEGALASRCREILSESTDGLLGDAPLWWPELVGTHPTIVVPIRPQAPEADRPVIWLFFAEADKPWADWIAATLGGGGYRIAPQPQTMAELSRRRGEAVRIMPLVSDNLRRFLGQRQDLHTLETHKLTGLRLQEMIPPTPLGHRIGADLFGISEAEAESRLLDSVGGPAPGWTFMPPPDRPPFPGAEPIHNLPPRPQLIGRDEELAKAEKWIATSPAGHPAKVAVTGILGIGKSAFAAEVAYRNLEKFRVVWWVRGSHINEDLAELAERLDLDAPDVVVQAGFTDLWLCDHPGNLIIFDDIEEDPGFSFINQGRNAILVTSRRRNMSDWRRVLQISLNALGPNYANTLLPKHWGTSNRRSIFRELRGHPRALEVAVEAKAQGSLWDGALLKHPAFTKFLTSFVHEIEIADEKSEGAFYLINRIALLADRPIPSTLWQRILAKDHGSEVVEALEERHLVKLTSSDRLILAPPLREVLHSIMENDEQKQILSEMVTLSASVFDFDERIGGQWSKYKHHIGHLIYVAKIASRFHVVDGDLAALWSRLVECLLFYGQYGRASRSASLAIRGHQGTTPQTRPFAKLKFMSGRANFSCGAYEPACFIFREAAQLAQISEDRDLEVASLVWAGAALLNSRRNNEAHYQEQIRHIVPELTRVLGNYSLDPIGVWGQAVGATLIADSITDWPDKLGALDFLVAELPDRCQETIWARRTIGRLHMKHGEANSAAKMFLLAERASGEYWGNNHPELAESIADLVDATEIIYNHRSNDTERAFALDIALSRLGQKHPLTARILLSSDFEKSHNLTPVGEGVDEEEDDDEDEEEGFYPPHSEE